jgi:flagellar FliL protein
MALRSGKTLMIILIAIVTILVLAVGGGAFYMYSNGYFDKDGTSKTSQAEEEVVEKKDTFKAKIENLVLNIPDTRGNDQLMKFSFAVKSTNEAIEAVVESNKEEILDATINLISARNSEELMTIGGKEILKEDMLDAINKILNDALNEDEEDLKDSVINIYFTDFVVK